MILIGVAVVLMDARAVLFFPVSSNVGSISDHAVHVRGLVTQVVLGYKDLDCTLELGDTVDPVEMAHQRVADLQVGGHGLGIQAQNLGLNKRKNE